MAAEQSTPWPEDVLASGHKRGCEGRNYTCTCGYDDAMRAEISQLRVSLMRIYQLPSPLDPHKARRIARKALDESGDGR